MGSLVEQSRTQLFSNNELRVLVVEDDHFGILPIQATLDRNHIPFDIAKNGYMAVERFTNALNVGYSFLISFCLVTSTVSS